MMSIAGETLGSSSASPAAEAPDQPMGNVNPSVVLRPWDPPQELKVTEEALLPSEATKQTGGFCVPRIRAQLDPSLRFGSTFSDTDWGFFIQSCRFAKARMKYLLLL